MFLIFMVSLGVCAAQETPTSQPTVPDPEVTALRTRVEALEGQLQDLQQAALLAEAEAMASSAPPASQALPSSPSTFNPGITAFADVLGTVLTKNGAVAPGSGPWLRSFELDIRAPVDPFANAVAVLAVEQEPPTDAPGEFSATPEEVYIDLVALPAGFSGRVGAFRQYFGVTNRAHPHDYPWPDLPLPLAKVLGEEGLIDTGVMIAWQVPTAATGITFQGALTRGTLFDPNERVANPAWLGRAEWFHDLGNIEFGLGASGTGQVASQRNVLGGDLMLRWRPSSWHSAMLLVEGLDDGTDRGVTAALQLQPTRPLYLGLRADWTPDASQVGGFITAYTSEFLRMRAGAMVGQHTVSSNLQLTFVWGSHPIEPYWVNR